MGRPVKDLNPFWQAVLCAVLAILVMRCWSEEGEQKPLDIVTIKRRATDRSTTSKPGWRRIFYRWERIDDETLGSCP